MLNKIYESAFRDELSKMASINKLITINTPQIPQVLKNKSVLEDREAMKKIHSGISPDASPAERRRLNVLKKSKSVNLGDLAES